MPLTRIARPNRPPWEGIGHGALKFRSAVARPAVVNTCAVSYTHLTLPTTPYV